MKRKLLSVLMISSGLLAFGQNNRNSAPEYSASSASKAVQSAYRVNGSNHVMAPPGACDTLNYPVPAAWTLTNYTTGTGGSGGYVNGPNQYADKEKAMYYNASSTSYTKVIGCWILFDHAYTTNPAKIVPVKVYDGTGGTPGTLLGSQNLTMGQIMADAGYVTDIVFTTPINLPASKQFFVSVDVTNLTWPGDSLSIVSNQSPQTNPGDAWEKWSDNTWNNMNTPSASGGWNLNISTLILPYLSTTGKTPISFTQNTTTVCQGGTINFDATNSMPYSLVGWSFGTGNTPAFASTIGTSPTITGTFNTVGTYPIWLHTLSGGCDQEDSASVSITVNALPTINSTPASATFCAGGMTTLTASGANTYSWTPSTGLSAATGSVVTANPSATTTYTITGTNLNNCVNTKTVTITVNQLPNVTANASSPAVCAGGTLTLSGGGASTYAWTGGATNGVAFTPASSATYTVTGTDGNNCSNTATVNVPVNPLPNVTATTSATVAVCPGTPVTVNGGGASNYSWSGGVSDGVSFAAPAATTTYTVTGTDANNCSNTATVSVPVDPVTTPTITANGTQLSSSTGSTYQWLLNGAPIGGANAQNYTATQNGNYQVITTNATGCADTSAIEVVSIIGIKDVASTASVKVYPNPSKGAFTLALALDKNNAYTLEIRNVLGQAIHSENINGAAEFKKSFDLSANSGLYFVIVKDNNGKSSIHKIVIE